MKAAWPAEPTLSIPMLLMGALRVTPSYIPALLNLWVATPFGIAEVKIGVAEKLVFEAPIPVFFFWSRAMKYFS